jgi:galactose oxidase
VFLDGSGLPEVNDWVGTFRAMAKGSYDFRGVEVTVAGTVRLVGPQIILFGPASAWSVALAPLALTEKVQWDWSRKALAEATADELDAYEKLVESVEAAGGQIHVEITGPLRMTSSTRQLHVRRVA